MSDDKTEENTLDDTVDYESQKPDSREVEGIIDTERARYWALRNEFEWNPEKAASVTSEPLREVADSYRAEGNYAAAKRLEQVAKTGFENENCRPEEEQPTKAPFDPEDEFWHYH